MNAGRSPMRVAVTGLGVLSACGDSAEEMWRVICEGRTGIRPCVGWDLGPYQSKVAGAVQGFDPARHFGPKRARRLDRCHALAAVAARVALADAGIANGGIANGGIAPERAGVFLGTSIGGMLSGQAYDKAEVTRGRHPWHRLLRYPFHVALDEITAETGFIGPRSIISTACTASTIAIAQALDALRLDRADIALAGGVDPLSEFTFAGFNAMQNMAPGPCAPFSLPIGLSLGEAAAFLVLERMDQAQARGARIYAELLDYELGADAFHPTSPEPSGRSQTRLFLGALERCGVSRDEVDYINAHGTGTASNDETETLALHRALGERASMVPVSSTKGATGHTLGAAGAVEALLTVMAVHRDTVPPTANFSGARPKCDLDYVPNLSRAYPVRVAVTQNFAFGGNNAALVFAKPGRMLPPRALRRVVATGIGVVSPLGIGREAFLASLQIGRAGIGPARFATDGLRSRLAATVEPFDPARLTRANTRRMDRLGQLTLFAAELALEDSGLRVDRANAERIGVVVGTMNGPTMSCKSFHREIALQRPELANPLVFPNTVFNAGAGIVAVQLRLKGPNLACTLGQASGLSAVASGFDLVRQGFADAMIAGGADELDRPILDGYCRARRVSPLEPDAGSDEEMSAPFDRRRNGMVLGEGAAFLMLESLESARARGAVPLFEILGHHATADRPVRHGSDPSGDGLARAIAGALAEARVKPLEIDYIAAGALSHPLLDAIEARALARVFGASIPPVAAMSSLVGVSGATGPLALAALGIGISRGFLPSGRGTAELDPDMTLDVLDQGPRRGAIRRAIANAVSLGGANVSLVAAASA